MNRLKSILSPWTRSAAGFSGGLRFSFFSLILLASCAQDRISPGNTLARVGDVSISVEQFDQRFSQLRQRLGLPNNGEIRRAILHQIINEQLLLAESRRLGLSADPLATAERKRIETQVLLDRYFDHFVRPEIQVSPRELQELFIRFNTRISARHLYAPTIEKADNLYANLQAGTPFEVLAQATFSNPTLKANGGSLGWFTADEMDPAFEDAAFRLAIGDVSRPVVLKHGYSIIQVTDRRTQPLLTEQDFANKRHHFENLLRRRKLPKVAREHVNAISEVLDLRFNEPSLVRMLKQLQINGDRGNGSPEFTPSGNTPFDLEEVVLSYLHGNLTVRDCYALMQLTSASQRQWINDPDDLREFLAGLVVREQLLLRAREAKLDVGSDYEVGIREQVESYLIERIQEQMVANAAIPDDSLSAFYERHQGLFTLPEQIQLSGILVSTESMAKHIAGQLAEGVLFAELAQKYSEDSLSATTAGALGSYTQDMLGREVSDLFDLAPGQWLGPVEIETGYALFTLTGRAEATTPPLPVMVLEVKREYRKQRRQFILADHLKELRGRIPVTVYPAQLMRPLTVSIPSDLADAVF